MKIRNDWKYKNDLTAFDIAEMIQEYGRVTKDAIEELEGKVIELEALLSDSKDEIDRLKDELEAANKRISELESE